jgi:hypothetical protein
MDCSTLANFRYGLYGCFERAGDALMNVNDALLSQTEARSLAQLSLSPFFVRRWPSLYEAFQDARIDRTALRRLFAAQVAAPAQDKRLLLGVDASSIARPHSPTAQDRTYVHAANLPEQAKPVTPGWQYSTLVVLPETPSSWTYVLDNQRICSQQTPAQVAAQQLRVLVPLLPVRPLVAADGYYGSLTFLVETEGIACDKLLRLAKNRVLYRLAPPRTGRRGAPRKEGTRFACNKPETQGPPDEQWSGTGQGGHPVEVACWNNLHFKQARQTPVSVLRVTRFAATGSKRDPRVSWFLFEGQRRPCLSQVEGLYRRRYSQEHGYRVDKQDLLWEAPRLRTPEQFQHWSDIVAAVRNQLFLARPLAQALRQPWESRSRMATPQQVRRAMGRILIELGTPARAPQLRGKSPGRCLGATVQKAPRFPVIYKATTKQQMIV